MTYSSYLKTGLFDLFFNFKNYKTFNNRIWENLKIQVELFNPKVLDIYKWKIKTLPMNSCMREL